MKDFAKYQQDTIVGVSLAVTAPGGQYDPSKLVNVGTNRWSIKPEIGISKAWGSLTTEVAAGVFFFTDNNQPFEGNTLKQDPIYDLQGHLIYSFGSGIWGALDTNYYIGGSTTKDHNMANNLSRIGVLGLRLRFPSVGRTPSNFTAIPAFIHEPGPTTTSSELSGSTAGEKGCRWMENYGAHH